MRTLAGAASTAVGDLVAGPAAPGRVVGVHPTCVYVVRGADLVALETADALGLPCAVRVAVDQRDEPFADVRPGDSALVGDGVVTAGLLTVRVARWWAPRPLRPGHSPARVAALAGLLAPHPAPVPVDAPPSELLGLGPGLTPAGDDVLAGLLVALHHHPRLRDPLWADLGPLASARTTALSAALLRHAAAGQALPAVVAVADSLAGHGPGDALATAVARLLAVGHSSGTALAHGLLQGARTVSSAGQEAA